MNMISTLALSFVLSSLIGMERQLSKKTVGFAPYVLVTTISTAVTLISITFFPQNPAIIVSGLISGIGFLGAAAVIKYSDKFFGFTTAAAIWAVAGFGIIVAVSDIITIAVIYGFLWAVIVIDKLVELSGFGRHMKTVLIEAKGIGSHSDIKGIIFKYAQVREESLDIDMSSKKVEYRFHIPEHAKMEEMTEKLEAIKGVIKIHVE